MIIWDYPINDKLVKILKLEYRVESVDKGNSWRTECPEDYLFKKCKEEYEEIMTAKRRQFPNGVIQAEIIDLIEVLGMLYWRLEI